MEKISNKREALKEKLISAAAADILDGEMAEEEGEIIRGAEEMNYNNGLDKRREEIRVKLVEIFEANADMILGAPNSEAALIHFYRNRK